ncbi:urea carboxylase [Nitrosomonas sp. HPC101]|uniref:urea carboxylase n=1 Tax=Nitrosomonas sp. HPC101 TaxID=1658667 RepID=UPI001368BEC5|nr:urea carboxylase [Nitrosomonas sp. HPC101]MXS85698.1 urea carboxylase [Nitrosomonas sp. HPC101]
MFTKILIANRGAIACRVMRTLRRMGIGSVAVFTEADALSRHVLDADESICIGDGMASESYLRADKILEVAHRTGAQAIHPGYGFLSENAVFAEQCAAEEICFLGPTPEQMRTFGLKHTARALAQQLDVPMLPGTGLLDNIEMACQEALRIGYPVMLKSTAGGGGIGMRLCHNRQELVDAYESVKNLAQSNFSNAGLFLEKYIDQARHVEVQIFGDGRGKVIALGERDCSMQRRNQKVIEETPAPGLSAATRKALQETAVRLGEAIQYRSAGTVEYVYDPAVDRFYFLEVNTRLQVEHGVTEMVTGIDLVEWMVLLGADALPPLESLTIQPQGVSIQARVYAENPARNFQPSSGLLSAVEFPETARIETWVDAGCEVSAFYDPMLAKIIVYADERDQAIDRLIGALENTALYGIETNLDYLEQVLSGTVFRSGQVSTQYLAGFHYQSNTLDVLSAGVQTTVQDYPGRTGYWNVGVPPSGPMDSLAFRLANRLVGNSDDAAGLEITLAGPTLKFNCNSLIAVCGAPIDVWLDDVPLEQWRSYVIKAGSLLRFGKIHQFGSRSCLAVEGGIQVPDYLGSKSTFTLGRFGGHAGRALRAGDVLHILPAEGTEPRVLPPENIPDYTNRWEIGVLYGPHGAPDFFTEVDIDAFFATDWKVHHNSSRTGIRLIGPKPQWARKDGGEAGLHPSNIHDNPYAVGAIDFTGDMPIILGPDGPSLGGFVCPAVIVQAELWKTGQLKPGDSVRFHSLTAEQALLLEQQQDGMIREPDACAPAASDMPVLPINRENPVLHRIPANNGRVQVVYRQSGDKYLLIEYGEAVLDIALHFRAHALMAWLQRCIEQGDLPGILDMTPGIRSLQIHFDSRLLDRDHLLDRLISAEQDLPASDDMEMPSRIVHLPLSWDDAATKLAIEKYMQSVRPDAPWCPSNIEFIRRINGLDSIDEVKRIVFDARYLVMGLGDVYLGAPVATPIDPRHRLVTTKYNPARTWTPENAVGIGGAYLCIYGMEGPGGYQFVGRTVQMWNRYRQTQDFVAGKPWLLRFFDQIRFYPVSEQELLELRHDFITGRFTLRTEDTVFSLRNYHAFLHQHADSIQAFKTCQQKAFEAERERWKAANVQESSSSSDEGEGMLDESGMRNEPDLPDGAHAISSDVTGTVWRLLIGIRQPVNAGDPVIIIESMKMEITLSTPVSGVVQQISCKQGDYVCSGQSLLIVQEE